MSGPTSVKPAFLHADLLAVLSILIEVQICLLFHDILDGSFIFSVTASTKASSSLFAMPAPR
jgi:hypothetical protein